MGGTRFEYKNIKNWFPVNEKFFPIILNRKVSIKNKKKKKKKKSKKKNLIFREERSLRYYIHIDWSKKYEKNKNK